MKHIKLLTIISTCLLVTSVFTVIPAFSAQPPVATTTYYVGTIGQPARLDPGRAYDTASAELIQNVYEPLIWFGDKDPLLLASGADHNLTQLEHADLTYPSGYAPVIAKALPIITPSGIGSGQYWNFTINPNAQFQNWTSPTNGGVLDDMPKRNVTTDDVVYSFQIQMVFDSPYAPVWMWEEPAFGITTFDALFTGGFDTTNPIQETIVGNMIQQWCSKDLDHPTTNVIFNFTYPLPASAMAQIFSQTWGSIVNKEFYVAHGCWDGSFALGWAAIYRQMPDGSGNRSPIDRYYAYTSQYYTGTPLVGIDVPDMCGTGPYKYAYGGWDQITKTWTLSWDPTYWRGWANAGDKAGNYITTITETGIDTWPTTMFLTGEFDTAVVPRANMYDLLAGADMYKPLPGLTLVTNITLLSNEAMFFCMNVSGSSAYQSYVGYPNRLVVDPYFFSDQNIRLAFAWALDYTEYIQQAYFGEAIQQASWWVNGLVPPSAKNTSIPLRNEDPSKMKSYLAQAALIGGFNVSERGFETTLIYNKGNEQRRIALQMIANAFASLGPKYKCNVVGLDWPVFLDDMNGMDMPVFCLGWQADFADPDDFAKPYMYSNGTFPVNQGPPYPTDQAIIDAEIEAAAIALPAARDLMYQDLQARYWQDCISIPLVQPVGRRFARDWVKGWYYNDLLPGLYFYDLYKAPPIGSLTNIDLDALTIVALTPYSKVFVSMGQMKVIFGGGVLAQMTFNVTVRRNDAGGFMPAIISLVRDNLTALTDYRKRQNSTANGYDMTGKAPNANPPGFDVPWPNGGWVYIEKWSTTTANAYTLLGAQSPVYPSQIFIGTTGASSVTVTLTWYEDGVTSTLPANATWSIGALVGIPCTAGALYSDTNTNNNLFVMPPNTYNCTAMTETEQVPGGATTYMEYYLITGDVNGDGRVDILDAIALSNSFLKTTGQPGFNPAADINQDGVANILDAILLSNNFNKQLGFLP